jgi:hypothetical protein
MQSINLYHDVYETENGDGFYPHLDCEFVFKEIQVTFKDEDNEWKQIYESNVSNIRGFDGDQGEKILKELNELSKKDISIIKDRFNKQIYPKLNKLSLKNKSR